MYYGSAEKGYTPLHKSKNILTRKDDEDFWSLAIVQKLNCDSETIIIFFLRFSIFQFFNGGGELLKGPPLEHQLPLNDITEVFFWVHNVSWVKTKGFPPKKKKLAVAKRGQ